MNGARREHRQDEIEARDGERHGRDPHRAMFSCCSCRAAGLVPYLRTESHPPWTRELALRTPGHDAFGLAIPVGGGSVVADCIERVACPDVR